MSKKLSDYTEGEIKAIVDKFTDGWPDVDKAKYNPSEKEKLALINTAVGHITIASYHLKQMKKLVVKRLRKGKL